jgi:hypothetical protein
MWIGDCYLKFLQKSSCNRLNSTRSPRPNRYKKGHQPRNPSIPVPPALAAARPATPDLASPRQILASPDPASPRRPLRHITGVGVLCSTSPSPVPSSDNCRRPSLTTGAAYPDGPGQEVERGVSPRSGRTAGGLRLHPSASGDTRWRRTPPR